MKKFSVAKLKQQLERPMDALSMSWAEVARETGVNKGLLSRINTGKAQSISAATLLALMVWAGLRVEDVMEDDGDDRNH